MSALEPLILAIDQGTTSSRAIAFRSDGSVAAMAQELLPQFYPAPGWVEQDGEDIWSTSLACARRAISQAEAAGGRIISIGITNQRETALIWDRRTLKPIHRAIVWQDRRTASTCDDLREQGLEELVSRATGLVLDPYFSAAKLAWMLDHVDGARQNAQQGRLAFGTVDSFLVARLTGGAHWTDATNASRTCLFNIVNNEWDEQLSELFRVPLNGMPAVLDSIDDFGVTDPAHFGQAIPIHAVIGDQQAAAVGQACFAPGDIKCTYGTGCFMLAPTGETLVLSQNRLLTTVALRIDGKLTYALEGSIFVAGAVVQWLRDNLGVIANAAESEALARSLPDNGGVYLVPAFVGLGAPYWAASARGAILGLSRGSGKAEIARAALESVAYQTADLIDAMTRDGVTCRSLKVDGGMTANDWLMQFLADIQNAPVDRPAVLETTALGAALLAGVKAGVFSSLEGGASMRRTERIFAPDMRADDRASLKAGWARAVERVLA